MTRVVFLSRVGRVLAVGVSRHFWGPWLRKRARWFALGQSGARWRFYAELREQRSIERWRAMALRALRP